MPDGNRTSDAGIIDLAEREGWIVVTKNADFVDSHTLHGRPAKLLLISTGNMTNAALENLILPLVAAIATEFEFNSFVELGYAGLIVRE